MKKFILCTFFFICTYAFSQNQSIKKPNYKEIKAKTAQKSSHFYFPKLMEKFKNADTTMTLNEKRHLYYGFIHQENYSPYTRSDHNDSLRVILKKKNYNDNDLKQIMKHSDSLLVHNPFNLNAINYKLYAEKQMKDSISILKDYTKMRIITDAILSSGDGLTKETAFFVISPTHENSILRLLGYKFSGNQRLIDHYDYLTISKNENEIDGIYFDISVSLNHMNTLFGKKE